MTAREAPDRARHRCARIERLKLSRGAVLSGVIAAELVTLYAVLNGNGWAHDDNLSLELAQRFGFSWHWLSLNLFGHWEIAHRAIFSIQNHLMPLDYRWALLAMLLLLGGAIYLFDRVLRMLIGGTWVPLLAAAYFGLSVLLVRPLQWWSNGLEAFPTLVCDLLCLYAYLRYQSERSGRWIAISAGAMAIGLLFYEKPAYMLLYLGLLRVLLMTPALRVRDIAAAVWRERAIWFAYVGVIVVWLIVREASGGGSIASKGSPPASEWVQFARVFWAQTLVPAVFGITLPASGLGTLQIVTSIALEVIVIGAVALSIRRKPTAWRAWASLAVCVVATGALVGQARLLQFGPTTGNDTRYMVDFSWLVPLMVCLAFSRRRAFTPSLTDLSPKLRAVPATWGVVLATAAAVVAYPVAAIATAAKQQRAWPGHAARQWEQHVQSSLAMIVRTKAHPVLADGIAPWYIVEDIFAPFNQLSLIVPHYAPSIQVDGPLLGPLISLGPDGRARPAVIRGDIANFHVGKQQCGVASSTIHRVERRIPPARAAGTGPYYLLVTYESARKVAIPLYVDHGKGYPGLPQELVGLAAGAHRSIALVGSSLPLRLLVDLTAQSGVCLSRLQVVRLGVVR
jgi:hypothetical protein